MTTETFPWPETAARLRAVLAESDLAVDANGRGFVDARGTLRFVPPLLQPIEGRDPWTYGRDCGTPGLHLVLLLQAGAAALGLWQDDALLQHKVFKRYVVRGRGRAQPTHLKTKGKSRYGSRLRLRMAKRLLEEVNERLQAWWRRHGPARVFHACPVRTWSELFRARPAPPFSKDAAIKIPRDVAAPGFEELLRVRRFLAHGRLERAS